MIDKKFLERMEKRYPGLQRVGEPLSDDQETLVRAGGTTNHGINLDEAFRTHFKPGSERIKTLIKTALDQK